MTTTILLKLQNSYKSVRLLQHDQGHKTNSHSFPFTSGQVVIPVR